MQQRIQIAIQGRVQGVGFRPFVACLAQQYQLTGWVRNESAIVRAEVQGDSQQLATFVNGLQQKKPPLAKIKQMTTQSIALDPLENSFVIKPSQTHHGNHIMTPDTTICHDCLQDLFNPSNKNLYLYPFISCSHCGPRFTTIENLPYDRQHTTFKTFPLCAACQRDYQDATNRRYHAQSIACWQCGPQLSQPVRKLSQQLLQGEIIAIKSLGGYHLMVDATNDAALAQLRRHKQRENKPFAVMALNVASANHWCQITPTQHRLLTSIERPIVLVERRHRNNDYLAPGINQLGVMLPYTPLHYLIFYDALGQPSGYDWLQQPCQFLFVATSGNLRAEPIIYDDQQATRSLSNIADSVVSYNRKIHSPCDDSVVHCIADQPFFIRRARGYVPAPIQLAKEITPTLALGGYLKNSICLTRGCEAFVSPYLGDLNHPAVIQRFHRTIECWQKWLNIQPQRIALDKQPDYYAARYAQQRQLPTVALQHHHAHLAQVAAEHHIMTPALGLALDGYGYGDDGTAWGGELLLYHNHHYQRLGQLKPLALAGGDLAAKQCWRMAVSLLVSLQRLDIIAQRYHGYPYQQIIELIQQKPEMVARSSSCGRYFDAASALLGVCQHNSYEGEAAMRLQSLVTTPQKLCQAEGWQIDKQQLNLDPLFRFLLTVDSVSGANYFHGTLVAALVDWVVQFLQKLKISQLLLAGGCFHNRYLTAAIYQELNSRGYQVYSSYQVPVNDGGLSLGQAWLGGQS